MLRRSPWWLVFGAGAALVIAALAWVSLVVLRLEADAQHQASIRLAMWRMDSWLGNQLAGETVRPYFEYLPFYAQQRAYTRILNAIEPDEVYSPSPLLTFDSQFFPLHFQVSAAGEVTSPQVPQGNWRDLAEGSYVDGAWIERKEELLERVRQTLSGRPLESCVIESQSTLLAFVQDEPGAAPSNAPPPQTVQQWAAGMQQEMQVQSGLSKADLQRRVQSNYPAYGGQLAQSQSRENTQSLGVDAPNLYRLEDSEEEAVEGGAFVPLWLPRPSASKAIPASSTIGAPTESDLELLIVRRVRVGDEVLHQGMLADWIALRASLLGQVADLFPRAVLEPLTTRPDLKAAFDTGHGLASIPAALRAPCPAIAAGPAITPARTTLAMTWLAVCLAIVAAGFTLRASIAYAHKRSRFASAVTHELRTPLTTFRMYSEMLAEGMVRDEDQKKSYLRTLKSESGRLATLVENVLSYARLEEGRNVSHAQRLTIDDLLTRVRGVLERRAAEAGMNLAIRNEAPTEASVTIDAEIVQQILFNLVDNACKYAAAAPDRTIELGAELQADRLILTVRDHGPGIPAEHARRVFAPFDRGPHKPGDTIPGVGLGLALARGLARDLGGELRLEATAEAGRGAAFTLSLPSAQS